MPAASVGLSSWIRRRFTRWNYHFCSCPDISFSVGQCCEVKFPFTDARFSIWEMNFWTRLLNCIRVSVCTGIPLCMIMYYCLKFRTSVVPLFLVVGGITVLWIRVRIFLCWLLDSLRTTATACPRMMFAAALWMKKPKFVKDDQLDIRST